MAKALWGKSADNSACGQRVNVSYDPDSSPTVFSQSISQMTQKRATGFVASTAGVPKAEQHLSREVVSGKTFGSVGRRIAALDMTKGVLVVLMVVYHSFNYSSDYTLGFKYLPFLPSSFILITGFLILYLSQQPAGSRQGNPFRMSLRGFRLLLLFTALNLAVQAVGRRKLSAKPLEIGYFFDHWFEIYVTGEARTAAFVILLPIAYLLILAPLFIWVDRVSRYILPALAVLLIAYCAVLDQRGEVDPNLNLLTAGMVGLVLGRLSSASLRGLGKYWPLALGAYAGYILLSRISDQTVTVHLLGACLAVIAIFCCCMRAGREAFSATALDYHGKVFLDCLHPADRHFTGYGALPWASGTV